ncbi:MAG: hemerythrin domain-containing protein [Alistipes sp.]|nr:hemerythrin domain-containing protein [Alistipes sp.]
MNKKINMAHLPTLSPEMKIFELVELSPSLLSIFSRLDIRLPFGDVSISEMCEREGHSVELFMMLASMHTDTTFRPQVEHLKPEMLREVIDYLRASHRYYAEQMLPHTAAHLEKILEHCDPLSQSVLRRFYGDYTSYIVDHFNEEERNIFSIIEGCTEGSDVAYNCTIFDMPHADIDDRSNDIASLIFKSLPEEAPTKLRCTMLEHIYALRDDLRRHSNVEIYLLRPLIEIYINNAR